MKDFEKCLCIALLLAPAAGHATWSVAKLDREAKTIVVAGASCSYMVYGIASVVPGKGVAIVQAGSNGDVRAYAAEQIAADRPLAAILAEIEDPDKVPDVSDQQYALLSFAESERPLTFTGDNVTGWKGSLTAPGLTVQANTMVGEKVVAAAFAAMAENAKSDIDLAEQAVRALRAGSEAGGDVRCGEATAASAFVSLYRPTDHAGVPYLNLVIYGIEAGTDNAVTHLEQLFSAWRGQDAGNTSTQRFVVP